MPLILLDGPEKSGKSTLAGLLAEKHGATVRKHYGAASPDDREYAVSLEEDQEALIEGKLVVYDRAWASEVVYGTLLGQGRRLGNDVWLAEWLYGRAVDALGLRVMVCAANMDNLTHRRDSTDLPVDPILEQRAFIHYARSTGYKVIYNNYSLQDWMERAAALAHEAMAVNTLNIARAITPPDWCGPPDASVVFVGQDRDSQTTSIGAWLPFSSRLTTEVGRVLGRAALACGWTNSDVVSPRVLLGRDLIVACGEVATKRVHALLPQSCGIVVSIPHPAWLYRYENDVTQSIRPRVNSLLTCLIGQLSQRGVTDAT